MKRITFLLTVLILAGFSSRSFAQKEDSLRIAEWLRQARKIYLSTPDSALSLGKKALASASANQSTYQEGESFLMLARTYWAKGNYNLSTEYGFKALKIFEGTVHTNLWGNSVLALARTFIEFKDQKQARIFLQQSFKISQSSKDTVLLAATLREFSMLLTEVG